MQQDASTIVEEVLYRARRDLTDVVMSDKRTLFDALRRSIYAEVREGLDHIGSDLQPPVALSSASAACHELWVTDRLDSSALLALYRTQHAVVVRHWTEVLRVAVTDPVARYELLFRTSNRWFAFYDRVLELAAADLTKRGRLAARDRGRDRWRAIRRLLDGDSTSEPCFASYDFARHHLALIVSGPDADRFVRWLAEELDARKLAVPVDDGLWTWLGLRTTCTGHALARRVRSAPPFEVRAAYGVVRQGLAGFRQSHTEATDAFAVLATKGDSTVFFGDVALEALMASDRDRCRLFVEDELGPLVSSDKRASRLRETLQVYFQSSMNATATAARLGVHDQTVAHRLRRVEELVGHPLQSRRAELEVALRLISVPQAIDGAGFDPTGA